MDIRGVYRLSPRQEKARERLLQEAGLDTEGAVNYTVMLYDEDVLAAVGSRADNVLKQIAIDARFRGEGLASVLITELRKEAFGQGIDHLFLYTKPVHLAEFSSLFFYPVAQTEDVLLLESVPEGIRRFVSALPVSNAEGVIGAAVMNCNPFTLGHRYLIETAARECDWLYVFVLSQQQPPFPARDRLQLVKDGTADIPNVSILPTGPYLISSATFPDYFLKDKTRSVYVQSELDATVFARYYAPRFHIQKRYVGTEPLSPTTEAYNHTLRRTLPSFGIELVEIPRILQGDGPISASRVRALLGKGQEASLRRLLPDSTLAYLKNNKLL